ncbi:MAG: lactate racemase domain-containing protein [Pirellulales bacterium]
MASILRYGAGTSVSLEFAPGVLLAECLAPRGVALDDPAAAVAAAMVEPLGFPPISKATVPDDRIVLALERGVPHAAEIVAGVVKTLVEAGVPPGDVTILQTKADAETEDPRRLLAAPRSSLPNLVTHDPLDHRELAYLTATSDGKPIHMNRALVDADLVLPIGCLGCDSLAGYHGINGGLYPAFSDAATLQRFGDPGPLDAPAGKSRHRRQEADEVGWLLGVQLTIQVVPGAGDRALHVLAGDIHAVAEQGRRLCEAAWSYCVPRRANLVVASIEGSRQQTWENVARALAAAECVVADDGAIALCTSLDVEPGPALRRITGAEDANAAVRRIRKEHLPDAFAAVQLARTMRRAQVFLLSRLEEATVEDLGLGAVAGPENLVRLVGHCESCILLGNAHRAAVGVAS